METRIKLLEVENKEIKCKNSHMKAEVNQYLYWFELLNKELAFYNVKIGENP
jgi:hypothetical protein